MPEEFADRAAITNYGLRIVSIVFCSAVIEQPGTGNAIIKPFARLVFPDFPATMSRLVIYFEVEGLFLAETVFFSIICMANATIYYQGHVEFLSGSPTGWEFSSLEIPDAHFPFAGEYLVIAQNAQGEELGRRSIFARKGTLP